MHGTFIHLVARKDDTVLNNKVVIYYTRYIIWGKGNELIKFQSITYRIIYKIILLTQTEIHIVLKYFIPI